MHVAPPVPDMEFDLPCRTYGGQYMQDTELRIRFTQRRGGTVHITAEDGVGALRAELTLNDETVQSLFDTLQSGISTELPPVPGLTRQIRWQISDGDDDIDLAPQLVQIHEWLKYELGVEFWDQQYDTWEF